MGDDMAKKKAAPKAARPVPQASVINLKGSDEYREWLDAFHKHTHIAKTTMFRLGMAKLAHYYKFQPPPEI